MARCYSVCVSNRHPPVSVNLPDVWLISDARNDERLEKVLMRLPRGSGLIYRHYHLPDAQRRARFAKLLRMARRKGHVVIWAGTAGEARRRKAQGAYGPPALIAAGPRTMRLITVHSLQELANAQRARADAVLLSPVFPTRSHHGAATLGPVRFRLIAARAKVPVIALGGMTVRRARAMGRVPGCSQTWAAIDGL